VAGDQAILSGFSAAAVQHQETQHGSKEQAGLMWRLCPIPGAENAGVSALRKGRLYQPAADVCHWEEDSIQGKGRKGQLLTEEA